MTAGEVHLERCVKDLRTSFANVPLNVSSPIVPFRETIVEPPTVDRVNEIISAQNPKYVTILYPCTLSIWYVGIFCIMRTFTLYYSRSDRDSTAEDKTDSLTILTPNKEASLKIKLEPIPKAILRVLEGEELRIKMLDRCSQCSVIAAWSLCRRCSDG